MRRYRKRYSSPFKLKLKKKTVVTISGLILLLISVLSILSLFFPEAILLGFTQRAIFRLFGWGAFFMSAIGIVASLTILGFKTPVTQFNIVAGGILSIVSLLGFVNIFSQEGAGLVGVTLWEGIASLLTGAGAALILLVILFIGIVILFNTSLDQIFYYFTAFFKWLKGFFSSLFAKKDRFSLDRSLKVREDETPSQSKQLSLQPTFEPVSNLPTEGKLWRYPPLSLLSDKMAAKADRGDPKQNAHTIEKTLESFGIRAKVVEVNFGPAVTQYALEIPLGTKISKITALQNDLALALATPTGTVRIEAPIPGKSMVGIEIPNRSLEIVSLKSVLTSGAMQNAKSKLTVALGLNVAGSPFVIDLAKMPHVLVAGTTGSGKSVLINSFITSLLFRTSPNELKLIIVDPKRVELADYNDIPHLLTPIIVDVDKILSALRWAITEMDRRYKLFSQAQVRNITGYNELSGFQALPYIVIIVDELADLMSFAPVEVEDAIIRLAQMARATGIHLVLATQRPSVDVITGLIKANIPCRIAFNVSSMVDSRVILDQPGAEKLLGQGDMLYLPPDISKPIRIQGVFTSDSEIQSLIKFLKDSGVAPHYATEVTEMTFAKKMEGRGGNGQDDLFDEAVRTVCQYDRASASLLQRRLRVGYARAARLLDELEASGIVGPGEGAKPRDVLLRNAEEFFTKKEENQNPNFE
jgi:S-DNA-T family DNA segregation ATPase FtsK/SpoIIIE